MPVSDTRLRISLVDDATGGLRSLTAQYDKFNQSIADSGKGYNSVATSSQTATNALDQQGKSLEKVDTMMQRVAYSAARYLVIYKGFAALGNIWDTVISGSFEYQKMLETNKLGMSGILMSMTEINGQALTFNQAMGVSSQIMKQLTDESLRTSVNVTDMVETFRGLLGPGLGAGMKIDEIVKLTSVGVTAVKSLGLPQNQLLQELRGMVQGGIKPASSTLATALGLKDADIKAAKASSEGLFAFLMNRLQGFNAIAGDRANTFEGRIERLKLGIQQAMSGGGANIFSTASSEVGKIADKFFMIEKSTTETGKEINVIKGLNPDILSAINTASEKILKLYSDLKDMGTTLMPAIKVGASLFANTLDVVLKNVKTIAASFALWKVFGVARDIVSVQTATENGYVATTTLGQGFQDIKNKLNSFNGELRITGELQNSLNDTVEKYNSIGMVQGNAVSNLSEKYTAVGLSAKEANTLQISVLETLYEHGVKAAQAVQEVADKYAEYNKQLQLTRQYQHEAGAGIVAAPGLVQSEVNNSQADYNNIANSKRVEESVTRLAQRYQELGMSAQEAGTIQSRVQSLILSGNTEQARTEMALHNTIIQTNQLRNDQMVSENERYRLSIANINKEYEETLKLQKAKNYIAETIKKVSAENVQYADSIQSTVNQLTQMGISQEQAYSMAVPMARALRKNHVDIIEALGNEIVKHAELQQSIQTITYTQEQLNARQKEYLSTDYSKLTEQQKQLLDFDTESILQKTKQVALVATIRGAYESLNSAVNDGMLSQQEANATLVELQKQVVAGNVDIAASIGNEITLRYQQGTLAADNAKKTIANGEEEAAIRQRVNTLLKEGITSQAELAASNAVNATGNKELANSYGSLIVRIRDVIAEMQRKGIVATEVEKLYVELLTKSTMATEAEMSAIVLDTNAALAKYEAQMKLNSGLSVGISSMGKWASRISVASMALVGLTGETDSWVNSAANFVFQAGFVISALEGINIKLDAMVIKAGLAKIALLGVVAAGGAAIAYAGIQAGRQARKLLGQEEIDTDKTNVNQNMWETGMPQGTTSVTNPNADAQETRDQYNSTNVADFKKLDAESIDTLKGANDVLTKTADLINQLEKKNFGSEADTGTSGKSGEDKEAKKLAEEQKKAEALEKANREFIAKTAEGYAADAEAFGHDGCTAFVDACLNSTDLNDLFDGLGRNVGNAWVEASNRGIAQSADLQGVLANAQRGDVIFYSSNNNPTGQHVGIYDGEGGVWHNASSADRGDGQGPRVSHANVDIGGGLQIMGFASVGGTKVNGADTTQQMTKYQAILGKYQTSLADITKEINSNKQAYTDEDTVIQAYLGIMDNANKKSAEYADTMARAAAIGIDTTGMKTKLEEYNKIMQEAATRSVRAAKDSNLQYATDEASRIVALNEGTTDDMNKALSKRLSDHQIYLENILTKENLSKEERAKYEQELTQVIQAQDDIRKTSIEGALQNISKTLRNYTVDYQSIISNVQDSVSSSFDGLFDGIITGQNSFVDNVHNAWNDIANTVMNAIWKMAMEMLVVKPLFNWLGGLFGGGTDTISFGNVGERLSITPTGKEISFSAKANGGLASGLTLVGEQGPELVDFANPGRVYTAKQTANALSNSGGLKDVKVEIVNKTSQEVKATSSNVSFDAKGYIIQVVLEAVSKNTNGTRDALKGAVTNY